MRCLWITGLLGLVGCPPNEVYPQSASVLGYEAPPLNTSYVLFYDPWPQQQHHDVVPVVAKGSGQVLRAVGDVRVTCTNMPCTPRQNLVQLGTPPPGVDHVEIKVEKDGYAPRTFTIPFREGAPPYPKFVVLMTKTTATEGQ